MKSSSNQSENPVSSISPVHSNFQFENERTNVASQGPNAAKCKRKASTFANANMKYSSGISCSFEQNAHLEVERNVTEIYTLIPFKSEDEREKEFFDIDSSLSTKCNKTRKSGNK